MAQRGVSLPSPLPQGWVWASDEPHHPLAAIEGRALDSGRVRVALGPMSRFGARYFALYFEAGGALSCGGPLLRGLHRTGPLPTYNWIEVAEMRDCARSADGATVKIEPAALFALLHGVLPPGGHLMVEYDSPDREETARALALAVPPIATPLGEQLFRAGFGAHFKDWQIAEGGSEGPRKLQAYKPASNDDAQRWKRGAARQLEAFLRDAKGASRVIQAARTRARLLLDELRG